MSWEPTTNQLWVAVNERDMLGDNLVPDYITHVQDGAFYGWPYYYWGDHRDERVEIPSNVRLQSPTAPDFALGAHTASLGLMFAGGTSLPEQYRSGAFIGQHGSWNRKPPNGYKVVFVPFEKDGRSSLNGKPIDVLSGFLTTDSDNARGRPVDVLVASDGALLVSDDTGGVIWRVTKKP